MLFYIFTKNCYDGIFNSFDNHINIYAEIASDYDVERMIEKIDHALGERENILSRGVGG